MIVKFVPKPEINSCTLFSGIPEFKETLIKENRVRFSVRFETKTHLDFSVQAGSCRFRYNEHSEFSRDNNLTLVEKKDWSYLSGQQTINNYFKRTKKQNLEVMKNHIISLTEKMLKDMHIETLVNMDTFVLNIELPQELMEHIDRQLSASRG